MDVGVVLIDVDLDIVDLVDVLLDLGAELDEL